MTDIVHPAYVYSAKFFPGDLVGERFILVTLCFDGKIRVYYIEVHKGIINPPELLKETFIEIDKSRGDQQLIDLRYPSSLTFGRNGIMFIGDSRGDVHIWEMKSRFKNIELYPVKKISDKEISGDPINNILIPNQQTNKILIHTRDNCIREINYEKKKNSKVTKIIFLIFR